MTKEQLIKSITLKTEPMGYVDSDITAIVNRTLAWAKQETTVKESRSNRRYSTSVVDQLAYDLAYNQCRQDVEERWNNLGVK